MLAGVKFSLPPFLFSDIASRPASIANGECRIFVTIKLKVHQDVRLTSRIEIAGVVRKNRITYLTS